MPENPEIRIMTDCLDRDFKNKMCNGIYIGPKSRYWNKRLDGFSDIEPQDGYIRIAINKKCNFHYKIFV